MPYPVEKGLFPLVLEHWFNEGLPRAWCCCTPRWILWRHPGPRRRLRAIVRYLEIASALRKATDPAEELRIESVTEENSFVYSSMFSSPALTGLLAPAMVGLQRLLAEDWFGMKWDPTGGPDGSGGWRRPLTTSWPSSATLGHWSGYYGNVELILCETLQRMLEVSLGVEHQTVAPTTRAERKALEKKLKEQATRVWPIYLFVTCPQPWFGASVTWQCHSSKSAIRGQVTTVLQTPGHREPIAPSPVDRVGDQPLVPADGRPGVALPNPYFLHGVDPTGANSGYAGRRINAGATAVDDTDPRAAPVRHEGDQGIWDITHENHDSTIVWKTFVEPDRPNWNRDNNKLDPAEGWDLPPIATYRPATLGERADLFGSQLFRGRPNPTALSGYYDVVVVSPSARDGGTPDVALIP